MAGPIGRGVVVKRNPEKDEIKKLLDYVETEADFCMTLLDQAELNNLARGERNFEWEEYQLDYFDIVGSFITNKPRQSGLSFACSAKYFATSQMSSRNFTAVFISYKKDEAINKINYVKQIMQCLPPTFSKKIIRDPLQMIEWENPGNKTRSKIYSHAQKPIRGMTADKILLDEFAFFTMAEIIYTSAFPALIQTDGTMDIISTPFGLGGMFYDILNDSVKYSNFEKWHIRWWDCMGYVRDPSPQAWADARKYIDEHPEMTVEERVYKYGSDRLIVQFENAHNLASFQQEFEGEFLDVEAAYFPKELIFDSMFDPRSDIENDYAISDSDQFFDKEGNKISAEEALADMKHGVTERMEQLGIERYYYKTIFDLMTAVNTGEITRNLYAGYDVGVTKNDSCLVILEEIVFMDGSTFQVERYREFLKKKPLHEQQDYVRNILSSGIIRKMLMDKGGIGWQMAEYLSTMFPLSMFEGVQLGGTSKTKERYMTNIKSRLQDREMALHYSKETIEHLYSIKREVRSTGGVVYTADEEKRHHADYAIALSLAALAGTQAGDRPMVIYSTPREGSTKGSGLKIVQPNSALLRQEKERHEKQGLLKGLLTSERAEKPAKGILKRISGSPIKPY